MVRTSQYLLILILVCSIRPILKCVYADWEEVKNIKFTDCHPEKDVDDLDECKKLAKAKQAQFFCSSETENDCNICYDFDDSKPEISWPYKSFVYIPNSPGESGLEFPVNMKAHLRMKQQMSYIVRIVIKSEIDKYIFARFYCNPQFPDIIYYTDTNAICQLKGLFTKNLEEINFEYKEYNGDVQFYMNFCTFDTDGTLHLIILKTLYVADYQPLIPGSSILNLIERMKDHFKIKRISLVDWSNIKLLSLYVYGKTYYQSHNYQYTNSEYDIHCVNVDHQQELLKSIQYTKINLTKLRTCTLGEIRAYGITVSDNFMRAFDITSVGLLPIPNIKLIRIKDLYTLNTQVLKKVEIPVHTEANQKVRENKRSFPKILSACIYDQIAENLKQEQIRCIKAIQESEKMLHVDTKIITDFDII